MQSVAGLLARKQADLAKHKEQKEAELKEKNGQRKDVAASKEQKTPARDSPGAASTTGKKVSFKDLMGQAVTIDNNSLALNVKVKVRDTKVPTLLKKKDQVQTKEPKSATEARNTPRAPSRTQSPQARTHGKTNPPALPYSSVRPASHTVWKEGQDVAYKQGDIWRMFHGDKRRRPSYSDSSDDMEVAGEALRQEEWRSYKAGQREDLEEERREREREEAKRRRRKMQKR